MANKLVTVSTLDEFKTKIEDEIPDSVQYSTMPTASADWVGKIVQYTGTTDSTYTNGYFYKCVAGSTSGTYEWAPVAVQEGGGSSVQSDWNETDSTADDYIKNKPTIPNNGSQISMTGYSKPFATSAIIPSDTVNTAIGKLEKGLEDAGGGESNIQVFKSTDFDPIQYGNYYYPVVVFDGKAGGKILGIKFTDANGKTRTLEYDKLEHHGSNLLYPLVSNKIFDTVTTYGVTIQYLGKGQYSVQGTASRDASTVIGQVQFLATYLDNAQLYTKVFNAVGEYGSLKIGGSNKDGACGFDEVKAFNYYGSSYQQNVYLHITSGETYDCTFYAEIAPMCFSSVSLDTYEAPFGNGANKYLAFCLIGNGLRSVYATSTTPIYYYVYKSTLNGSNFGVIDYPIIHAGKNIFGYYTNVWKDPSQLPVIEIYYTEDPQTTIKDNIAEIEYSISNGHFNKYKVAGSFTVADSPGKNYVKINAEWAKQRSPITPEGLWFKVIATDGALSTLDGHYLDFIPSDFKQSTSSFYVPKSDFYYYNDELYVKTKHNPYLAVGSTHYYCAIPDWDGFDDSVTT